MRAKRTVELRFSVAMPVLAVMNGGDNQATKEKLDFNDEPAIKSNESEIK